MAIGPLRLGGDIAPKTFHINRSINLTKALRSWGWREVPKTEPAEFAYWDIFGGVPHVQARVNVWPRECTNVIDNLYPFFERLYRIPGMAAAAPVPFTLIGDAWRTLTREEFEQAPDSLWFIKDVFGVRGNGVTAVNTYADYQREVYARKVSACTITGPNGAQFAVADRTIIQHAIRDTLTMAGGSDGSGAGWRKVHHSKGGRKTGLRAYIVTRGDGAVFLCEEMINYVHGVPYDPSSTDLTTQSIHGTQANTGRDNFLLSTWDDQDSVADIVHNCMEVVKTLVPLYHSVMQEHRPPLCDAAAAAAGSDAGSRPEDCRLLWHFWGVDFIASMDNSVQLIEMNGWCNLHHTTPGELEWHARSAAGMMEILGFGAEHGVPVGEAQPWKQVCEPLWRSERVPYYPVYGT